MKHGALSVEQEILTKLGCFNQNIKGSGTVTAAASIFLASRYAADPFHGIVEAGFARGADTDTVASMTGGILGALAGIEWLGNHAEQVQDARYLMKLAEVLSSKKTIVENPICDGTRITKSHLDSLLEKLEKSEIGDRFIFSDGREVQTSAHLNHQSLSKTTVAVSWKLTATDGQSLYVKKNYRLNAEKSLTTKETIHIDLPAKSIGETELQKVNVTNMAVKLRVRNIENSRFFYEMVLGLRVEKESKFLVKCGNIVLVPLDPVKKQRVSSDSLTSDMRQTICIEVESLEVVYSNVCQVGAKILKETSEKQGWLHFTCLDPDGNAVEIDQLIF
jgi:predicted enzyme related to lactoylglutathione lyase